MQQQNYPGSDLTIEKKLSTENKYKQYIASYISDGLKIYGLLTVPNGSKPKNGWPVIIFNHGYIRPSNYKTTVRYELYVKALANDGYIVFKPDYRGNGNSQGNPDSQYFSPDYTIDAINALATLKGYKDADANNIGMWGHSDGGNAVLRSLVIDPKDIKAAVIWGAVVGPYSDLTTNWQSRVTYHQTNTDLQIENKHLPELLAQYSTPENNPVFWNSIDPLNFLQNITTPLQINTGGSDEEVPTDFSSNLYSKLLALGKKVEYYNYPNKNHNISILSAGKISPYTVPYPLAMEHTLAFFDTYLKH